MQLPPTVLNRERKMEALEEMREEEKSRGRETGVGMGEEKERK